MLWEFARELKTDFARASAANHNSPDLPEIHSQYANSCHSLFILPRTVKPCHGINNLTRKVRQVYYYPWEEIVRMYLIYYVVIAIHFSRKELYLQYFAATCFPLFRG